MVNWIYLYVLWVDTEFFYYISNFSNRMRKTKLNDIKYKYTCGKIIMINDNSSQFFKYISNFNFTSITVRIFIYTHVVAKRKSISSNVMTWRIKYEWSGTSWYAVIEKRSKTISLAGRCYYSPRLFTTVNGWAQV